MNNWCLCILNLPRIFSKNYSAGTDIIYLADWFQKYRMKVILVMLRTIDVDVNDHGKMMFPEKFLYITMSKNTLKMFIPKHSMEYTDGIVFNRRYEEISDQLRERQGKGSNWHQSFIFYSEKTWNRWKTNKVPVYNVDRIDVIWLADSLYL